MRVALDATYSVDPNPSGIAVYSREILDGLSRLYPDDQFLHCFRLKQLRSAPAPRYPNAKNRILQPPFPTFHAELFHALNQRVDRRPAKKVVSTFHDLFVISGEYSSPEFRARFTDQARRAADNSDLIIAVSEFTANQISSLLHVERGRIRVIHHGVHLPHPNPAPEREKFVLFVGALQVRKNVARLVEAFETLPPDWRLVLAGASTGFGSEAIRARINSSPGRERIQVTGYLPAAELDRLYRRAAIFAFPSLDEGFGIPVLEAMAYGVPVITSNTSALKETAGTAALLVDPKDTDELAGTLNRLAGDGSLRTELAETGLAHAKRYSWEEAARETHAVYLRTLAGG